MERPRIDVVLRELSRRGIQCGLATTPTGGVRAWIEVDGALLEGGVFEITPNVSDQVAHWIKETADRVFGVRPDNVVDARSYFSRGR